MPIKTTITIQSANKQCNGEYLRMKIQYQCAGDWQREWRRMGKSASVCKQNSKCMRSETTINLYKKWKNL